jgi:hypothetical protein
MNILARWWRGNPRSFRDFYRETGISPYTMLNLMKPAKLRQHAPFEKTLLRLTAATGIPLATLRRSLGTAKVGRGHKRNEQCRLSPTGRR